ncbi:hypothetical protein DYI26_02600 [Halomonas litopenaei]|nr:hypothetical protein [Halomonas litopenaei]
MAQTIKLNDDELLAAAKESKDLFSRSLNGQIEYWARLGRFVEESGLFDLQRVNLALQGRLAVDELSLPEQHAHAQMLWHALETLDGTDDTLLKDIEGAGADIHGLDDQQQLTSHRGRGARDNS